MSLITLFERMSMNDYLYHNLVWNMVPGKLKPNMDDAIDALGDLYNSPTAQPFRFNFENDTILKYAYFYRYFVCISNAVKVCWTNFANEDVLGFLKNKREMNVCCVGGGSGCDLVGLCQFLDNFCRIEPKINAVILDYYDWSKETRHLIASIERSEDYGIDNFEFVRYDFFKTPIKDEVIYQIRNADVITIVKFLSAVGTEENEFGFAQLKDLLSHGKRNAYVFFMDNSGGPYKRIMEEVADDLTMDLVCEVVHKKIRIPDDESEAMGNNRFHTLPLKSTSVSASLWKLH